MTCKDCLHIEICEAFGCFEEDIGDNTDFKTCKSFKDKSRYVEIDDDFCTILICAERYALGRQSYMPKLVTDYISQLIKQMDTRSLIVMKSDLTDPTCGYGNEKIDKPMWIAFLDKIKNELKEREQK